MVIGGHIDFIDLFDEQTKKEYPFPLSQLYAAIEYQGGNENIVQPFSTSSGIERWCLFKGTGQLKVLYTNMIQSGVYSAENMKC